MSVQVQWRRGTALQVAGFKGAAGEIAVDTTNNRVVVQDGATTGGFSAAKLTDVPLSPSPNGAVAEFTWVEQTVTLSSGSSVSFTLSGMPSYSGILFGISARVTTAITGSGGINGFGIGTANSGSNGYNLGNDIGLNAGTTSNGTSTPGYIGNSTTLYVNAMTGSGSLGGTFSGGVVRLSALVLTILPPAS
jgi:Major tropism determinant N-terminal domain